MIFPPPLPSAPRLLAVAPSSPFDPELLKQGLARLTQAWFRVESSHFSTPQGFLAGSDDERCAQLQQALDDPELDVVLVARGGYGLARIVPRLDFERFRKKPKWLVGFSDTTVLHAQLWNHGIASLHAGNATTLGSAQPADFEAVACALRHQEAPTFSLQGLRPGRGRGRLVGGNLTVLFAEAAAGRLFIPEGSVLFLEDVSETSYRIDRMLVALRAGGHLSRCSALVFGDFTDCWAGRFEVPVVEVIRQFSAQLDIPCATGLPVGHGPRNHPLVCGVWAELNVSPDGDSSLAIERPDL